MLFGTYASLNLKKQHGNNGNGVMRMAASVAAAALLPPPSGTPASYICCQVTAQDCFKSNFAEVAGKPQTSWQLLVLMKWSLPAAGSLCTHQHETRRVPGAGGIARHSTA